MKITRFALVLMMLGALAACGTSKDDKDKDKEPEAKAKVEKSKEEKTPICPQVAIIRDLSDMKDYGTEKPDASELVAEAKLISVQGECSYKDNGIDITFDLGMAAAKGPRLGGLHAGFPYFVAVVAPDQTVLNKDKMTADFHFSSDSRFADMTENLHVFIPLSKESRKTGPDYRVLMGFQLDDEQLGMARKRGQKTN